MNQVILQLLLTLMAVLQNPNMSVDQKVLIYKQVMPVIQHEISVQSGSEIEVPKVIPPAVIVPPQKTPEQMINCMSGTHRIPNCTLRSVQA